MEVLFDETTLFIGAYVSLGHSQTRPSSVNKKELATCLLPGDVDSSIQPCDLNFDLNYGSKKMTQNRSFVPQVGPHMLGISMLIAKPIFTAL